MGSSLVKWMEETQRGHKEMQNDHKQAQYTHIYSTLDAKTTTKT